MAVSIRTITFGQRQPMIPNCRIIILHTTYGLLRAEYADGTEQITALGDWSYQFWINEEDLPGSLEMDHVCNSILQEPFITPEEKCCGGCNEDTEAAGDHIEEFNFMVFEEASIVTVGTYHWMHRIEDIVPTNFRAWVFTAGTEDLLIELLEEATVVVAVTILAGAFHSGDAVPTFNVSPMTPNAKARIRVSYPSGSGVTPPFGLEVALRATLEATPVP